MMKRRKAPRKGRQRTPQKKKKEAKLQASAML